MSQMIYIYICIYRRHTEEKEWRKVEQYLVYKIYISTVKTVLSFFYVYINKQ